MAGVGAYNRFAVPTFAAEFRCFKKVISHLFGQSEGIACSTSGHLSFIGVHVPPQSVCFGLSLQVSEAILVALKNFIGGRPIVNAQGFFKPFVV